MKKETYSNTKEEKNTTDTQGNGSTTLQTVYRDLPASPSSDFYDKLVSIWRAIETKTLCENGDPTFEEILNLWLKDNLVRLKGGTISKYRYLIDKHILPELGEMRMSFLTSTVINSFLTEKLNGGRLDFCGGLSVSYVRSIMLIINSAHKFAVNSGVCLPLKTPIHKPASKRKEPIVLSREEQRKLEHYLFLGTNQTKIGVLLSLHTGLRIGEICALSWKDIDLTNQIIHVRHTVSRIIDDDSKSGRKTRLIIDSPKTKASVRDIPITSALLPFLKSAKTAFKNEYVVSDAASFLSPRTYEYRYNRLLKECGISHVNYHALRHTFATRCIEAGVDPKSLSELLGHANVGITLNTYVHSSMELKRQQLEKLSNLSL